MDKFVEGVQGFCLRALGALGVIIFLFLTGYSWRYTMRHFWGGVYLDTKDNVLVTAIVFGSVCVGIGLIGKLVEKCPPKLMLAIAVLVSIVIAVTAWIFVDISKPYAISDQGMLQWGATALAEAQADLLRDSLYFIAYSFQLYQADLFALLFRLFRTTDPILIYRVQAVLTGFATFAIFGITRELFHNRKAEMLSLLCALMFFPMRLYAAYFYGDTLGVCASLYAIWFFIKMNQEETIKSYKAIVYGVLVGLFLLLAFDARGALLIVGIAMCIIQILRVMKNKHYWLLAVFGLSMVICFGGRFLQGESLERRTGISQKESAPFILWVMMGFQESGEQGMAVGTHNGYDIVTFEECGCDVEAASRKAKQDLMDRFREWINEPGDMISFLKKKILIQWNEPMYGSIISTAYYGGTEEWVNRIYENGGASWLVNCLKQYQAILYLFLLGGFVILVKGQRDAVQYLIGLIMIGGFLFSLIWEAETRYIYPYVLIAIPFAAGSAVDVVERGFRLIKKRQ